MSKFTSESSRAAVALIGATALGAFAIADAQCHSVIARMGQHMGERKLPVPGKHAIKDIDAFPEQHTDGSK